MAIETEMFRLLFLCHEGVNLMELSMREKELLIMFRSERRLDTHKRYSIYAYVLAYTSRTVWHLLFRGCSMNDLKIYDMYKGESRVKLS